MMSANEVARAIEANSFLAEAFFCEIEKEWLYVSPLKSEIGTAEFIPGFDRPYSRLPEHDGFGETLSMFTLYRVGKGGQVDISKGNMSYSPVRAWHCGQTLNDSSNCRNAAVMFGDSQSRYCEPCANAYQEYMTYKMN